MMFLTGMHSCLPDSALQPPLSTLIPPQAHQQATCAVCEPYLMQPYMRYNILTPHS